MMNTKSFRFWTLFMTMFVTLATTQCDKKSDDTEEELITRIVVRLTATGGGTFDQSFEAIDSDGDGVFNSIDSIAIPASSSFTCTLSVYDDTKNPVENITEEIQAENVEHLFVFNSNTSGLSINNLNTDDNGAPFGLTSIWQSGSPGSGTVQIKLIHEPTDKNATDPGGETDFDVTFNVTVQ